MTLEGRQLGHYRLQRFIGSGTMGAVYLAEDTRIACQVAIKIVPKEEPLTHNLQATDDVQRRFHRDMNAVTSLDHPHILPLLDFGEQTIKDTTCTYVVMPYRPEGSLVGWLQQRKRSAYLLPQEVVKIVRQAADALQYAHTRQMLHLDVKPSNFLLRQREDNPHRLDLLLADFGRGTVSAVTSTASPTIRGTPPSMAPEQWAGTPTFATDQYALAIMTYHLLTSRFPFADAKQQTRSNHLQDRPQPPSIFNPHIPPPVDEVILRALENQPEDRFASVQDFATAFELAWQQQGMPASPPLALRQHATVPPHTPTNASGLPSTRLGPSAFSPASKQPANARRTAIIGLIALVVVGCFAFAASQRFSSSPSCSSACPQLDSAYSGYEINTMSHSQYSITLFPIVETQDGHFTGTYSSGPTMGTIEGAVTQDDRMTFIVTVTDPPSGVADDYTGKIYGDGHLEGNWEAEDGSGSGTWNVS